MASASEQLDNFLESQLICHHCKGFPRVGEHRWYRCVSEVHQHLLCQHCIEDNQIDVCPCHETYCFNYCEIVEELLERKTIFKCKNQARGCTEVLEKESMLEHQAECIYRLIECPFSMCCEKVQFRQYLDHLTMDTTHRIRQLKSLNGEELFDKKNFCTQSLQKGTICTLRPTAFEFYERIFFNFAIKFCGMFYHMVFILGSSEEAKNYSYTIKYFGKPGKFNIIAFTGQVRPIDDSPENMYESADSFVYPFTAMEHGFGGLTNDFIDKNRVLTYSVKIINKWAIIKNNMFQTNTKSK